MKRRHIPLKSKLAAALACLLPQADRDYYRRHNTPADEILQLFEFDHIALCALGGSDLWWNLDPKSKAEHREKSRRDTSIVAKVKRIQKRALRWGVADWTTSSNHIKPGDEVVFGDKTLRCISTHTATKTWRRRWPSRKLKSRTFPKGRRRRTTQT